MKLVVKPTSFPYGRRPPTTSSQVLVAKWIELVHRKGLRKREKEWERERIHGGPYILEFNQNFSPSPPLTLVWTTLIFCLVYCNTQADPAFTSCPNLSPCIGLLDKIQDTVKFAFQTNNKSFFSIKMSQILYGIYFYLETIHLSEMQI